MKRDIPSAHPEEVPMSLPRVDYTSLAGEAYKGLLKVSHGLHRGSLDSVLLGLVKQRASQINGCTFCLDMHGKALREAGIDPRKLDTLAAWHESPFYDPGERAALAWTEALTRVGETHAPDEVYAGLLPHFDETQIAELTFVIAIINAWNRMGVGLRSPLPPG